MLCQVEPLTLEFLNQATQAWVEMEYNRSPHEGISSSPLERMLKGTDASRPSPSSQDLRFAFTQRERRTQRRSDGTVSIQGVRFEVPSAFRHLGHLWVGYQSFDLSLAYLVDHRSGDLLTRLYPQDKTKNAQGYRRSLETESKDLQSSVQTDQDPVPPLLRKLLADYAATGLPPGYIPHEKSIPSIPDQPKEKDRER